MGVNFLSFNFYFLMDKQSIYIHKKEATIKDTPTESIQDVYRGGPKPYINKGSKQKQTSPQKR